MKKITVIGTGYVGLVTGAHLAEMGHSVTCLDINEEKIASLKAGVIPFYEPGLGELVTKVVAKGHLRFTESYEVALPGVDICFLALPTPSLEDGSCDLTHLMTALDGLSSVIDNYLVIVNKSTVPVGTGARVRAQIQQGLDQRGVQVSFDLVSNPEFLREGSALSDCAHPHRILLGTDSNKGTEIMKELYAPHKHLIQVMDIPSCEMAKYAANAMLALRLSLMNDLSVLCEKVGANIESVATSMGKDPRIGPHYLNAGIGFGGSCLPKDVKALNSLAQSSGHNSPLLPAIVAVNEAQKGHFFEKILAHYGELNGKTLALWGLSFKPDTDDLREAPSLYLIRECLKQGASLKLYDPVAMPKAKLLLGQYEPVEFCENEYDATHDTDGLVLVTEWPTFMSADFEKIGTLMREKTLFDGRNFYSEEAMKKLGYTYYGVGKATHYELSLT